MKKTDKDILVIENGEEFSLPFKAIADGFVYFCDECGFYHLNNSVTKEEVQKLYKL